MLKGAYRLLNCPTVESEGLWHPQQEATRRAAGQCKTVLFIQDWTTLDYSHQPKKTGIGPVGSRRQRGMVLHSVRAYALAEKQILGLAYGQVIVRDGGGGREDPEETQRRQTERGNRRPSVGTGGRGHRSSPSPQPSRLG
jgi:hypothetical protein